MLLVFGLHCITSASRERSFSQLFPTRSFSTVASLSGHKSLVTFCHLVSNNLRSLFVALQAQELRVMNLHEATYRLRLCGVRCQRMTERFENVQLMAGRFPKPESDGSGRSAHGYVHEKIDGKLFDQTVKMKIPLLPIEELG
ncbi:unnamed protein product [Pleuronectes platessa]|uniref:Uncharacterized protein n=1 Tax=Pleuronectes platessa TaxID=8262 RepID=A0A9N7W261_PLEPL|nr:unnamed protein product [Pleuronectes platessa]